MATHNDFGKLGEDVAYQYLIDNGYKVLAKNWRFQKAEIDIIAQKKDILAIVEVKTRSTDFFGLPQDFVSPKKIKLLIKAAHEYVIQQDLDVEVRFDIIAIVKNTTETKLDHITEAFHAFD